MTRISKQPSLLKICCAQTAWISWGIIEVHWMMTEAEEYENKQKP
jgi:hypothetical protein